MYTVGIDTGGTFTDAFVTAGDQVATVKVETTPHDLTVCFAEAIRAAAEAVGLKVEEFLRSADVIRFSSTIGTNTILTHTGPRVGLLVTKSAEADLYGASANDALFAFVAPDMVVGIEETIGADGETALAPDAMEVNQSVRSLLERGSRILVVSLRNGALNDANELAVKELIDASYPRHYLGAVPVLLSTQISASADDARRTTAAIVNAYMHQKLATSLYKAEDDLRRSSFRHPLLVVNTDGGATRVAKTRALATYQSGPTSGIYASALLCRLAGIDNALTADVGGTSTDVGLVAGRQPVLRDSIDVGGLDVVQASVELVSFGIGGGSIVHVQDNRLRVGPESAGAAPGPACFGLGGREPTPTDAWLVLGYLDPGYYLGGRKQIDVQLARQALQESIAEPLGLSVEEAALAIKDAAEEVAADGIREMLERPSVHERLGGTELSRIALVAFGGGGGLLMPEVARRLGIGTVLLSRFSPVFSAFGVSTFDVRHRYQTRANTGANGSREHLLGQLVEAARRDMRGEGFDPQAIEFAVSVYDDGVRIAENISLDAAGSSGLPRDRPLVFELVATCLVEKPSLPEEPESEVAPVPKSEREVVLASGRQKVSVYARETLGVGVTIQGPALVEATDTTYLLPENSVCRFDRTGSGVLTGR